MAEKATTKVKASATREPAARPAPAGEEAVRPNSVEVTSPDGETLRVSPKAFRVSYKSAGYELANEADLEKVTPVNKMGESEPVPAVRSEGASRIEQSAMLTPKPINPPPGQDEVDPANPDVNPAIEGGDEPADEPSTPQPINPPPDADVPVEKPASTKAPSDRK